MRHSSTCVDNTIIYLGIQYLRKYALGTPRIVVILPIWTSTWIIPLSRTSRQNKRWFQSYNKRRFSFKGSYLDFIALKEIQIRFATVPILKRERRREGGGGRERETERSQSGIVAPSSHKMEAEVFGWRHAEFTCERPPAQLHPLPSCSKPQELTCFFLPLMNTRRSKLDCLFKCMITVYDIVMDVESIIISLLKAN